MVELALSFLEIISDFGMFLFFLLIVIYIVYDFFYFFKTIFLIQEVDQEGAKFKFFDSHQNITEIVADDKPITYFTIIYVGVLAISTLTFVSAAFISKYAFSVMAFSFEFIFLFYIFSLFMYLSFIQWIWNGIRKSPNSSHVSLIRRLHDMYYNSKINRFMILKEVRSEIDEKKYIDPNKIEETIIDKNNIGLLNRWLGALFCIYKNSNYIRIASLNGMFEKEKFHVVPFSIDDYMSSQIQEDLFLAHETSLHDTLLNDNQQTQLNDNNTSSGNLVFNNRKNDELTPNNSSVSLATDESSQNIPLQKESSFNSKCSRYFPYTKKPRPLWYKFIIGFLILAMQISYFVYFIIKYKKIIGKMVFLLFIRIMFLPKTIAYNFIDFAFHPNRVWKSLKETGEKIAFVALMGFYGFMIAFTIFHYKNQYSKSIISNINNAYYAENNSIWFKYGMNKTFSPESFCYIKSPLNDDLKTEDLAMMTTLPRLYDITDEGKCYIKPSMRGLFNSTMKYIFGKNYEKDEITIFCKKLAHYPILIITSEKIFNKTLEYFKYDKNITFYQNTKINITNSDFFEEYPFEESIDKKDTINLLNEYKNCTSQKGTENCEKEWDIFTQNYWSKNHNNEYEDIPGFERYQIDADGYTFMPRFATSDQINMSGVHYIVGGSFEDKWGMGFLTEAVSRSCAPIIFEFIIPFYRYLRNKFKEIFIALEYFNKMIVYSEHIIDPDINTLAELYKQFYFSRQSLFIVGHTFAGTMMKGISYYKDFENIRGVTFESLDAESALLFNKKFANLKSGKNKIVNLYSHESLFSQVDEDSFMNVQYFNGMNMPNVYKTACLTAITCSETMKYVPFCEQAFPMQQETKESFYGNLTSYLHQYGYK